MASLKKGQRPAPRFREVFANEAVQVLAPEPAPVPKPAQAPEPVLAPVSKPVSSPVVLRYRIAEGKAVTSKRGILGPGTEVKVEYLTGGATSLDELVAAGYVEVY
jgi:hypothetical protein